MAVNDKLVRRSIPLASADFDSIKASLKTFLRERPELADYDFNGATVSVLIDELALNSHINAFYLNMVGNEAFLKTAVMRDSVVSRAEMVGYAPRSVRSSSASLYVEFFVVGTPAYITVPKYTMFTATASNVSYLFYTVDDLQVFRSPSGQYIADGIEVVQGKFLTHRFVVDQNIIDNGVIVPNANVDTSRFDVSTAENTISTTFVQHFIPDDITGVNPETTAYYLREIDGFSNVYFGDDVLGKKPVIGSVVRVIYPISVGAAANGAARFTLASSISGVVSATTLASGPSFGGAVAETIDSIKFNAPKSFEAQKRAVTDTDYVSILKEEYGNIDDAVAWGGQDNDPPRYGKVFVAIKPSSGFFMTDAEKEIVYRILKRRNVVSVTPIIVDPDYIFLSITDVVDFDTTMTDMTSGQIETIVRDRIFAYSETAINRFEKTMRKSVMSRIIDNSDPSIISNTSSIRMEKRFFPRIDVKSAITQTFSNPVLPGSFISSKFTFNNRSNCYFADVGGVVGIFIQDGDNLITVLGNAGTINYTTGTINTEAIEIDSVEQIITQQDSLTGAYYMSFYATPTQEDIATNNKQIVQIVAANVSARQVGNRIE